MRFEPERQAVTAAAVPFALVAIAIGLVWWRLGSPVALPSFANASGQKLYCVSYAPFRDGQDPLLSATHVAAVQIEADLAALSRYTDCVRTYSTDFGLDKVAEIARHFGLKVLQGLWLSGEPAKNRQQIAAAIELGKKFPDTISAIVVGNEVLLRGEMSVTDLIATIREVKAQVPEPVTYADVWEFWLRYRDVQSAVDFVTIHVLPYWEDFPLPARLAAAHVDEIRKRVAAAIPGKEIMIGEVGWPSAGRMREGALPSPSNQARVIDETLARARRENFRVNVIEAFDQNWKRQLEGAVGAYWGIFDAATRRPKFSFAGGSVSDHPQWPLLALAGMALAVLVLGAGALASRSVPGQFKPDRLMWWRLAALALLPGMLFGWTLQQLPIESFMIGGWLRSLAFAAAALASPVLCGGALMAKKSLPGFSILLAPRAWPRDRLGTALGVAFIALFLLAAINALGLVFNPRYRDIEFAPLCCAVVPFLFLPLRRKPSSAAASERLGGAMLAAAAIYILFNETFANWQAVFFCLGLSGLSVILLWARAAPD